MSVGESVRSVLACDSLGRLKGHPTEEAEKSSGPLSAPKMLHRQSVIHQVIFSHFPTIDIFEVLVSSL
jgi:hypothetical protein